MTSHKAVVLGATGAVGGEILKALCASLHWQSVTTLGRRVLDFSEKPWSGLNTEKVQQEKTDVSDPKNYDSLLAGHTHAFCAFGIGQPTRFSRQEYLKVDIDIPLKFAQACIRQGIQHFTLMTSVGSDAKSRIFYLRTKGELEEGVSALSFERVSLFRPSTLVTPTNRYGLSQGILLSLTPFFNACLHGSWKKYRGIKVEDLGRAMVKNAETKNSLRVERWEWPDFDRLVK
jgi:uncharacterized protein YbjT (DUF2867 family)